MIDGERAFESHYGAPPEASIRVPGRVNLIGDHIDYCGLPVLPAALQRHLRIWVRARRDALVRIENDAHGSRSFEIVSPLPPSPAGDWSNYVKAAIAGLAGDLEAPAGFDALMASDLPQSAGLSSSSAVVVAAALAFLFANRVSIDRTLLAGRLSRAERYVGTEGGGMDQAIILLAEPDHASLVEFEPLRASPIRIPRGWAFIVVNSLETAQKTGAAREAYNSRPREAAGALRQVARHLGKPDATYADLVAAYSLADLREAAGAVGMTVPGPLSPDGLRRRFEHVVTEADRVARAVAALRADDLDGFGRLMLDSHDSLRTACEVSTPRIDRLVRACMDAGASGARLTGAGFGGCVVALIRTGSHEDLLRKLAMSFYAPLGIGSADLRDHLFHVVPAGGASIIA